MASLGYTDAWAKANDGAFRGQFFYLMAKSLSSLHGIMKFLQRKFLP